MNQRRIQLIAGTTYTISLPKEWVKKNSLREGIEVNINEKGDGSLIISPNILEDKDIKNLRIDLDEYKNNFEQIVLSASYIGFETISISTENNIDKETRRKIKETLRYISGAEIVYEDKQKITINVLIKRSRLDIVQILNRIGLLIDLSISYIQEGAMAEDIEINEQEVDRLFNLAVKIVTLSLIDTNTLISSKIENNVFIPNYFLIAKKLENLADNIYSLYGHISSNETNIKIISPILSFYRERLGRNIRLLSKISLPTGQDPKKTKEITDKIIKIKDQVLANYLKEIERYIADIEGEIVNISFYRKLIKEDRL